MWRESVRVMRIKIHDKTIECKRIFELPLLSTEAVMCQVLIYKLAMARAPGEWAKWDFSSPIFDSFFIMGPREWKSDAKSAVLYEYPPANVKKRLSSKDLGLHAYIFDDEGINMTFEKMKPKVRLEYFLKPNVVTHRVVTVPTLDDGVMFAYCTIFRASPITVPGLLNPDMVANFEKYRKMDKIPVCDFAMCFVSGHPFSDFMFGIHDKILKIDLLARSQDVERQSFLSPGQFVPDDADPVTRWPCTASMSRESFLEALYRSNLPGFGAQFVVQFSKMSPLVWNMPTADAVATSVAKIGARPLFDWITLDDFMMVMSALLREMKILVVSQSLGHRSTTVAFLSQLISPFHWCMPIVTVVGQIGPDLMGSPMAELIALAPRDLEKLEIYNLLNKPKMDKFLPQVKETLDEQAVLVVHLDKKRILYGPSLKPIAFDKALRGILEELFKRRGEDADATPEAMMNYLYNFIRTNFADKLCKCITRDESTGECTFHMEKYPELFPKRPECQEFLTAFMGTQHLRALGEQMSVTATKQAQHDANDEEILTMTLGNWHEHARRQARRLEFHENHMDNMLMETHIGDVSQINAPFRNYS